MTPAVLSVYYISISSAATVGFLPAGLATNKQVAAVPFLYSQSVPSQKPSQNIILPATKFPLSGCPAESHDPFTP